MGLTPPPLENVNKLHNLQSGTSLTVKICNQPTCQENTYPTDPTISSQKAGHPNKEITKGDTRRVPVPKQMHQTRCIRCTRCTRPDVSTASLLLVTIRPCTNCNSGIATSQDCVKKQRENQKVHATPQPTLAPAKIVLEKYAIRKPCCKCTGIAVGASNLSQPWRFLPC